MNYYVDVIKKYATFEGRARRREYWMFVLINVIISIVVGIVAGLFHDKTVLPTLYNLFVFLPSLAVSVRRLHDINKSGWYILFSLIPLVGWIFVIVWLCTEGNPAANSYGENPKATPYDVV